MNEPSDLELSAAARQVIADARGADDPSAEDQARVKARWLAGIAAGAGVSSLSEAVRAAASGWAVKAGALAAAFAAATAGVYLGWPQPSDSDGAAPSRAALAPPPAEAVAPPAESVPLPTEAVVAPAPAPAVKKPVAAPEPAMAVEAPVAPEAPAAPRLAVPTPPPSRTTAAPVRPRAVALRPVGERKAPAAARVELQPAAPSVAAAAVGGQLGEELTLISEIRRHLQGGSASRALEQLAEYRGRFAQPHLAMEADALQVDALCQSGDRAGARAAATVFATNWPASPLQQRVSAACP